MSLLDTLSSVRSSSLDLDELELAFHTWAHDPDKPDVVDLGRHGEVAMVELARELTASPSRLAASACRQLGLPYGVTIGTAANELLHVTVAPDGPRCRSFRSASYYLRGLIRLDADLLPETSCLAASAASSRDHPHVR